MRAEKRWSGLKKSERPKSHACESGVDRQGVSGKG